MEHDQRLPIIMCLYAYDNEKLEERQHYVPISTQPFYYVRKLNCKGCKDR